MADYSDLWTDETLAQLTRRLSGIYDKAERELRDKAAAYFSKFEKRYLEQEAAYKAGEYTKAQFDEWVRAQIGRGRRWERLADDMAHRMTESNELATHYMNDTFSNVYAENYNYSAFLIEDYARKYGDAYKSISFNLLDANTVKRLSAAKELTMLPPKARIDYTKDEEWNKRKIQNSLLQGILQGESIDKMATRLSRDVGHMNRVQAVRAARTMCTEAQNAGRQQNYLEAEALGIEFLKEWVSASDDRVRESHAELDGVRVKPREMFPNHLEFPGDHRGEPKEVYNCRCTMRAVFPKYASGNNKRYSKVPGHSGFHDSATYEAFKYAAWKSNKLAEANGGKFTEITKRAINNVPFAKTDGMTDEEALFIQQKHKELLTHAMENNSSNEVAFIISNDHTRSRVINGDRHGVSFGSTPFGEKQIVMHNHPGNTSYSTTDLNFFLNEKNVETFTIIKNNGTVEILRKTGYYDYEKCRVIFSRCVGKTKPKTDADYNKVVKMFVGKCQKEGLLEWTSIIF